MSDTVVTILAAGLGLIFGSFASVVAYRIPRRESIVSGRSKCPSCGHTITAMENIPVVSYVLLRGRCKHCSERISPKYPLIELATAALFAFAAARFGLSIEGVVFAAFFWALVVLTVIDLEHRILPDRIVVPAFIVGWAGLTGAALADGGLHKLGGAALGALVFGGFFFVVAFVYPVGMGFGDVKLGFVLGSFLGWVGGIGLVLVGMFLSFVLGSLIGVALVLARGGNRKSQLPFGPYLALGTIVAIAVGQSLVDWYQGLL